MIALARFVYQVDPDILSTSPIDLTNWPCQLVHRLLGALTESDMETKDTVLFAEPSVRYWLQYAEQCVTIKWSLFSWQVVQIWARAIQDQLADRCAQFVCLDADLSHHALKLLHTVLSTDETDSMNTDNQANALLCEAFCMTVVMTTTPSFL